MGRRIHDYIQVTAAMKTKFKTIPLCMDYGPFGFAFHFYTRKVCFLIVNILSFPNYNL